MIVKNAELTHKFIFVVFSCFVVNYQDGRFPITLSKAINGLYMTKEKIIDKVKNYESGKIA